MDKRNGNDEQTQCRENLRKPAAVSRRTFLGTSGKLLIGAASYLTAAGGLFYFASARSQAKKPAETDATGGLASIGKKSSFDNLQGMKKIDYSLEIRDGWVTQQRNGFVYAVKDAGGELLIMSPVCTHLGCTVALPERNGQAAMNGLRLTCPCHGGVYNELGKNVGGPPPRPLDVFRPMEKNGELFVDIFAPVQRKRG